MMKKYLLCLILLIIVPTVTAIPTTENVREMLDFLSEFKKEYNNNMDKVPGWGKSILGSEKLNVTLFLEDNSVINIGIIFNNGAIVEMRQARLKNPTINLFVTEKEIKYVLEAKGYKERLERLKLRYDQDKINFQYVTFRTKVKFGTVGMAYGLFQSVRNG
ncbi:MAG: hypothetical protein QGH47_05430 [Candidatus Woesearchaeota archaeon]|jgi:hypothetical protein|nr:hypothetical protein [Candidatus Woesearchaeota archaeon]